MSLPGQQSTAHEYDSKTNQCVHCGMSRINVILLSHDCTPEREAIADAAVGHQPPEKKTWKDILMEVRQKIVTSEPEEEKHGE